MPCLKLQKCCGENTCHTTCFIRLGRLPIISAHSLWQLFGQQVASKSKHTKYLSGIFLQCKLRTQGLIQFNEWMNEEQPESIRFMNSWNGSSAAEDGFENVARVLVSTINRVRVHSVDIAKFTIFRCVGKPLRHIIRLGMLKFIVQRAECVHFLCFSHMSKWGGNEQMSKSISGTNHVGIPCIKHTDTA